MISHPARTALLLTCLALGSATAGPVSGQELKDVVREARGAVVSLEAFDLTGRRVGSGTGFFVQSGVVVTNYHVAADARSMEATLADGRTVAVEGVIASAEGDDLALLGLSGVEAPALPLAGPGSVEPGDRIVVLGNPLGLSGTVSDGLVAALRPDGLGPGSRFFSDTPLLQVTAPVSPGSSGSPVLDGGGEVVGVAVGAMLYGQNLNFAIPSASLIELLGRADLGSFERSFSATGLGGSGSSAWPLARNLLISALFFAGIWLAFRRMRD